MIVDIKELETTLYFLISKLKKVKGNNISLKSDYYWDISNNDIYNPYETPTDLTLGQLSDDLEEIKKAIKEDNTISYDLQRIANILRALSYENYF